MTPQEYQQAVLRIQELSMLEPEPDSFEARELIALLHAVSAYEKQIYPIARVMDH